MVVDPDVFQRTHDPFLPHLQEYRYLSSIAVKDGKVFALFVRCSTKQFDTQEKDLRHIIESFRLI